MDQSYPDHAMCLPLDFVAANISQMSLLNKKLITFLLQHNILVKKKKFAHVLEKLALVDLGFGAFLELSIFTDI